jgi:hypothetical protein
MYLFFIWRLDLMILIDTLIVIISCISCSVVWSLRQWEDHPVQPAAARQTHGDLHVHEGKCGGRLVAGPKYVDRSVILV